MPVWNINGKEVALNKCPSCGRTTKSEYYEFCRGCKLKREKVIDSMLRYGYSYDQAEQRANESYPSNEYKAKHGRQAER
jgi:hypothetical protein